MNNKNMGKNDNYKVIGSITTRPLKLKIDNDECNVFYVDHLCISEEERGKNIAPKLILKIEPAVWAENQECEMEPYSFGTFNMYIFKKEGIQLPFRYLCRYGYYYKKIDSLLKIRDFETPNKDISLVKLTKEHIQAAYKYFINKIQTFKLYQIINIDEFTYIFLNDIVDTYLLIDTKQNETHEDNIEYNKIKGFTSFYNSQFIESKTNALCCELFYIFGDNIKDLAYLTFQKIKDNGYNYVFTTNLLDGKEIVKHYKFDFICYCHYHLYNYFSYYINPNDCAFLIP